MANPFASAETYDETLTDPIDGEEWKVTMRVLNAGDRAVLQDQLRIEMDDDGNEATRLPMGTMKLLTVDRAVVRWTLPLPKTRATIAALREDLFDQLFEAARFSDSEEAEDEGEDEPSVEEVLAMADPTPPEPEAQPEPEAPPEPEPKEPQEPEADVPAPSGEQTS